MLPGGQGQPGDRDIRGIQAGVDCASPSRHTEFSDVDSMLDFVERIADATGVPVGIKSAVGNLDFWDELIAQMADRRARRRLRQHRRRRGGHRRGAA